MFTITNYGAFRAQLHGAYWPQRHYWRERVADICASLPPRQLVTAARMLAAITYRAQLADVNGAPRLPEDIHANMTEVANTYRQRDPRDIALAAFHGSWSNVNRDERGWSAPAAPDPYDGARHTVVAKRSNSGRTDKRITRVGVAPVIGRTECAVPYRSHRQRGGWRGVPQRWASLAPVTPVVNRVRYVAPTLAPSWSPVTWTGREAWSFPSLALHLVDNLPRRASGANAIAVTQLTAHLFRDLPEVSDVRQWAEVTPELAGADLAGWAVHRADMSGQTGVLALTDTYRRYNRVRWPQRHRLARIGVRKSERASMADHELAAPSAHDARVFVAAPTKRRPACWPHVPQRWRQLVPQRTVNRTTTTTAPGIWLGHRHTPRGPLATPTRGNRARRTIGTVPTPETLAGWQTLAETLAPGERYTSEPNVSPAWTLNYARSGDRYSATITAPDGTVLRARRRTAHVIASQLHAMTT